MRADWTAMATLFLAAAAASVGTAPTAIGADCSAFANGPEDQRIDAPVADPDPMKHVVSLMNTAQQRLERAIDPGPETQALQVRIVERLDDAIAAALRQRMTSQPKSVSHTDERQMPDAPDEHAGRENRDEAQGAPEGSDGKREAASVVEAIDEHTAGPLRETRRGWGHLPQRDREEILQSMNERVLDAYRELADRYYRTLAETEDQPPDNLHE